MRLAEEWDTPKFQWSASSQRRYAIKRSRTSGVARDLARSASKLLARSLRPLVKARAFGMTQCKDEDSFKIYNE